MISLKKKHLSLFLILLLTIITCSTISATDITDNATDSTNIVVNDVETTSFEVVGDNDKIDNTNDNILTNNDLVQTKTSQTSDKSNKTIQKHAKSNLKTEITPTMTVNPSSSFQTQLRFAEDNMTITVKANTTYVNEGTVAVYRQSGETGFVTSIDLSQTNSLNLSRYFVHTGSFASETFYLHYYPVSEDLNEKEISVQYKLIESRTSAGIDFDSSSSISTNLGELVQIPVKVYTDNNIAINEGVVALVINNVVYDRFELSERAYAQVRFYETMNRQTCYLHYYGNSQWGSAKSSSGSITVKSTTTTTKPTVTVSSSENTYDVGQEFDLSTILDTSLAPGNINIYLNGSLYKSVPTQSRDTETETIKDTTSTSMSINHAGNIGITAQYISNQTSYFTDSDMSNIYNIYVNPVSTTISADNVEMQEGETKQLKVTLSDANSQKVANQTVTIKFFDSSSVLQDTVTSAKTDENGEVLVTIPTLSAGVYDVSIDYDGGQWQTKSISQEVGGEDYTHAASTANTRVTVTSNNIPTTITLNANNTYVSKNVNITGQLTSNDPTIDLSGKIINLTIGTYTTTLTTGTNGVFTFTNYQINTKTDNVQVKALFEQESNLETSQGTTTFNVQSMPTEIITSSSEYETSVNSSIVIRYDVVDLLYQEESGIQSPPLKLDYSDEQGRIDIYYNGVILSNYEDIKPSNFEFVPYVEEAGEYIYTIVYTDTDNIYNSSSKTIKVTVNKVKTNITLNAENIYATQQVNITGKLTANASNINLEGKTINLTINGNSYSTTTDIDGNFEFFDITMPTNITNIPVIAKFYQTTSLNESNTATDTFDVNLIPVTITATTPHTTKVNEELIIPIIIKETLYNTQPIQGLINITDETGNEIDSFNILTTNTEFLVPTTTAGTYTYTITYTDPDNIYETKNTTVQVTVEQVTTTLTLNAEDIYAGQQLNITGTLTTNQENAQLGQNTISLTINGQSYTAITEEDGSYTFNDILFNSQTTSITVKAIFNEANGLTTSNEVTDTFDVKIIPVQLNNTNEYTTKVNQSIYIPITLNDTINNAIPTQGNITIKKDGNTIVTIDPNKDTLEFIPDVTVNGVTTYTIEYSDSLNKYAGNSSTVTVTVESLATNITLDAVNVYTGQNINITGKLNANGTGVDLSGHTIKLKINENDYTAITGENGTFNFTDLTFSTKMDDVVVTANFDAVTGLSASEEVSTTFNVMLLPVQLNNTDEYTTKVNETVTVPITLNDTVNGVVPTQGVLTIKNGSTVIITIDLASCNELVFTPSVIANGETTYTIEYSDSLNKYAGNTSTVKVIVESLTTTITLNAVDVYAGQNVDISGKLSAESTGVDLSGRTIKLNINGEEYTATTVADGNFTFTDVTFNTKMDNVVVTANFDEVTGLSASEEVSTTFNVKLIPVQLNNTSEYYTKVNDAISIPITLNDTINGVIPTRGVITIKNGTNIITTIDLSNNDELVFTPDVSSNGETTYSVEYVDSLNKYAGNTSTVKVIVNSLSTNITLNAEDVYTGQSVNISGKLNANGTGVDLSGRTIKLNINGQDYTATTTTDGNFTFTGIVFNTKMDNVIVKANFDAVDGLTSSEEVTDTFNVKIIPVELDNTSEYTTKVNESINIALTLVDTVNTGLPTQGVITIRNGTSTVATINVGSDALEFVPDVTANGVTVYTITYVDAQNKYDGNSSTVKVTVESLVTTITLNAVNVYAGQNVNISGKLNSDGSGVDLSGRTIKLNINGDEYTATTVVDGNFTFTGVTFNSKMDDVVVTANFDAVTGLSASDEVSTSFNVMLLPVQLNNTGEYTTKVNESVTVPITLNDTVNGVVPTQGVITIRNGTSIVATINVGSDVLEFVPDVTANGVTTYTITYVDDNNKYDGNSSTVKITVESLATTITLNAEDIYAGQNVNISGKLSAETTGVDLSGRTIKLNINGDDYTTTTVDGGNFTFTGVTFSTKMDNVVVTANFDEVTGLSASEEVSDTFNVKILPVTLTVEPTFTTIVNDSVSVTINLVDMVNTGIPSKGLLNISKDGVSVKTINVTTEELVFNPDVTVDEISSYHVVYIDSDNTYETKDADFVVNVIPIMANVTVNAENIYAGQNVNISGQLTLNKTGTDLSGKTINLTINNNEYTAVTDENGKFTFTNLVFSTAVNNIPVTAKLDKIVGLTESNTAEDTFDVLLLPVTISVQNKTTFVGENLDTSITLTDIINENIPTTGTLTVKLGDNIIKTINVASDELTFTYDASNSGEYVYTITYTDLQGKYQENVTTSKVTVGKLETSISTDNITTIFGTDAKIIINVLDVKNNILPSIGIITIMDDEDNIIKTLNVESDTLEFTHTANSIGKYNYTLMYSADKNYNSSETKVTVTVNNKIVTLDVIEITDANIGENNTIRVLLNAGTEKLVGEKVNINIDGVNYTVTTDDEGIATLNTYKARNEKTNIPVSISYEGNSAKGYGEADTITTEFNAYKIETIIKFDPITSANVNSQVTVTGKLTDKNNNPLERMGLIIVLNDKKLSVKTDDEGTFILTFNAVTIGENNISASYEGNYKYISSEDNITVNVNKVDTIITINPINETSYSDTVTITGKFTDKDGNIFINTLLKVTINNKSVNVKTDKNGLFTVTTKVTVLDENNVNITFAGNTKFNPTNATAKFNVVKKDVIVTLNNISNVMYSDNITITGKLSDTKGNGLANSHVMLLLSGRKVYVKTLSDGSFTLNTTAKTVGENTIKYGYDGSTKYNSYLAETTFNVTKQDVIVTINNISDIEYGDEVTISGKLTDVNGVQLSNSKVMLVFNGKKVYVKTDVNGEYTLTTAIKIIGEVNLEYGYAGSNGYNQYTQTTSFNVKQKETKITANPIQSSKVGDEITITGKFTDKDDNPIINTNLVITINNIAYTTKTDNTGTFTYNKTIETAGPNNIIISYNGNNKYKSTNTTITFTTNKKATKLSVNRVNAVKGDSIKLVADVVDEDNNAVTGGNLVFKLSGLSLKSDGKFGSNASPLKLKVINGKVEYTITVDETLKNVKNISASYSGSNNYYSNKTSGIILFNVSLRDSELILTTKPVIAKQNTNISFIATLNDITEKSSNKKFYETDNDFVIYKINGKTIVDKKTNETIKVPVENNKAVLNYTVERGMAGNKKGNLIDYNVTAKFFSTYYNSGIINNSIFNVKRSPVNINFTNVKVNKGILTVNARIQDEFGLNVIGKNKYLIKLNGITYTDENSNSFFVAEDGKIYLNIRLPSSVQVLKNIQIVTGERCAYESSRSEVLKL